MKNSDLDENTKKQILKYLNLKYGKFICVVKVTNDEKKKVIEEFKKIFNLTNESILEIDVNDYCNEHTISTLLGTSPGYVGYDDGGILSKHIMRHNINLVLFDNYNNDVNNLFNKKIINKILNHGSLMDYQGNKINFINTIIVFNTKEQKRIGLY